MTPVKLLKLLQSKQIQVWVEGERLRYNAPKGSLTDELRRAMRDNKAQLIEFLRTAVASDNALSGGISRASRGSDLQLAFSQERIWFLDQLQPGTATYNIPVGLQIDGELDVKALQESVSSLHQQHEILRTTYPARDGRPSVVISENSNISFEYQDLRELLADRRETQGRKIATEVMTQPFDLASGPLFRAVLLALADTRHWFLISVHHIISDGWSLDVLFKDLSRFYDCYKRDSEPNLNSTSLQYVDFAQWQREYLQGETLEQKMKFWRKELQGDLPVLQLPTDRPRPPVKRYRGRVLEQSYSIEIMNSLRTLSKKEDSTLFMILLAAYVVLLRRYTGLRDFTVGTPIAGRERAETHDMIGFFVNTLVLRFKTDASQSFRDLLHQVKAVSLNAFAHQEVPFEKLVDDLQPNRNLNGTPFFSTMFTFHQPVQTSFSFTGLTLTRIPLATQTSKFDLNLSFFETKDGLKVGAEYDSDLFEEKTISRFLSQMRVVLQSIGENPNCAIEDLPLLSDQERCDILFHAGLRQSDLSKVEESKSIFEFLQRNFANQSNAVAIEFEDQVLTYAELERRACILSSKLKELGITPEDLIGIHLNRSPNLIVAILGIWMAGGAYVPLDPMFPKERLAFMVEDSDLRIVISEVALSDDVPVDPNKVVQIDGLFDSPVEISTLKYCADTKGESLAYVIYTSGSTGVPKGVQIQHRALFNFLNSMRHEPGFSAGDSILAVTTLSFDISVLELILPLICGGKVVIANQASLADGRELSRAIDRFKVTVMQATPATWDVLLESGWEGNPNLKALCGGEAMRRELKDALVVRVGELWNMYGPTETTVWSTVERMRPGDMPITVGKPIANTTTYVLDHRHQLVPVGVAGELHIGGEGLARGYWQRPELTSERFIPDPFRDESNARLYRTGDLAKFRSDGKLEILGRIDHQVKIRGYRIELGEVEAALARHASVGQCVVVARENAAGEAALVAFVTTNDSGQVSPDSRELRQHLRGWLPDYMIPSAFMIIEQLPLTPNGKIDRSKLPLSQVQRLDESNQYVAPRNTLEARICKIWENVLSTKPVGIHDNFFLLGGHSLLAVRLVAQLEHQFDRSIQVATIFQFPTVAELAECVRSEKNVVQEIPISPGESEFPLSFAQQRLWFLEQLEPGTPTYNIPVAMRLNGLLDKEALEKALRELQQVHGSLRSVFTSHAGDPVQVLQNEETLTELKTIELSQTASSQVEIEALQLLQDEAKKPFDLAHGPLFRAVLISDGDANHYLLLNIHHIVGDGWSLNILLSDLGKLYNAFRKGHSSPLHNQRLRYVDYAAWQKQQLRGDRLDEQLGFWRAQLEGASPNLDLPTDHPRPAKQTFHGDGRSRTLPKALSDSLRTLAQQERVTLFMTVLAIYNVLLYRYSGKEDIVVGSPIAGRSRRDTEGIVGLFVNTLALRTRVSSSLSFSELLRQVRDVCLGAYENQDAPFEYLVEMLQPGRDLGGTPLFQTLLNVQEPGDNLVSWEGLELSGIPVHTETAKFDLTLSLTDILSNIVIFFEFNTDLFSASTIDRMLRHFQVLAEQFVAAPDIPIRAANLLTAAEMQQVTVDWNSTQASFEGAESLHALISERCSLSPDSPAIIFDGEELSYADLDRRSTDVALRLIDLGVTTGSRVGVFVNRSPEMVVGVLGVLKSGGSYVPLDPVFPSDRLAFMIEDSELGVLLTQSSLANELPHHSCPVLVVDESTELSGSDASLLPLPAVSPDEVAYVIYTSGSTGQPKGVAVSHCSVVNFLHSMQREPGFGSEDVLLAVTTLSFDISVLELFLPLISGGRVVIASREASIDGRELSQLIESSSATVMQATPATWRMLLEVGWRGNDRLKLLCGGEALAHDLASSLLDCCGELWNMYGPTETTVWSTLERITDIEAPITVGCPIANTQIYILDRELQPTPIGVHGELHIGGAGLAEGYWRRPELTSEKFIANPFSADDSSRLYRTGDLARWRNDGKIEILGRIDHQVKLRGFRIELGEIESLLNAQSLVHQSVAIVREDRPGDKRLVAYYVSAENSEDSPDLLRAALKAKLPEYMIPSNFVRLQSLPLTANGKIDRKSLPEPEPSNSRITAKQTGNSLEQQLKTLWEQTLGIEDIAFTDDFFEIGGHSLLAVKLFAHIENAFGMRLPLDILFQKPTIRELAEILCNGETVPGSLSLVGIQDKGSRTPLFFVPPAASPGLVFARLARALGAEQPMYGLTPKSIEPDDSTDNWFETTAESYIRELKTIQPSGPYLIGGRCFGGFIAYEMAQKLVKQGDEVAMLLLMDVGPPLIRSLRMMIHHACLKLLMKWHNYKWIREHGLPPFEYVLIPFHSLRFDIVPQLERRKASQNVLVWDANLRAAAKYVTRPYAGQVTLLHSSEYDNEFVRAQWKRLAVGGLDLLLVEGGHEEMLKEPLVQDTAKVLQGKLDSLRI